MTVSLISALASTAPADGSPKASAPQPADPAATEAFEKAMPNAPLKDVDFHHQTSRSGELRPLQKFESFVLRSFIENMLPSQNTAFFGTGTAGNIWRSMLAEQIGDEMASAGGVGIAKMLEKDGRAGPKDLDPSRKTS
ncbi:rod-binding protein [Aureimonas sp. SK2]|uniref:rod-binding protein n=1 Tax=Aureimonas sp. SK2 TaxID=3015992 RepID=UPI002444964E|nr:rod-binding protein [Aureimonas sp. SK2]